MARKKVGKRLAPVLACAVRMAVVFTLAFSTTLSAQAAWAASQDRPAAAAVQKGDAVKGGSKEATAKEGGASEEDEKPDDEAADDPKKDDSGKEDSKKDDPGKEDPKKDDSGKEDPAKDDPAPKPGSSSASSEAPAKHFAEDMGLYLRIDEDGNETPTGNQDQVNRVAPFAYASQGKVVDSGLSITKRDGEIALGVKVEWSDVADQCDPGSAYVTYAVDDTSLATIRPDTGVLKATGGKNGTVVVTATFSGDYTEDGKPLEARASVALVNQESTPYVTGIEIWDGEKDITRGSYTFPEGETMRTATIALQAKVATHDPVSGQDATYTLTTGNGLSKQTGGAIADITWEVVYDDRGSVSADGEYRAIVEGDNTVRAVSHAGPNGAEVVAEAMIVLEGAGHAQESLTIDAVWETQPDSVVTSKTLSVDDVRSIGAKTQSYTVYGSFGNSNFVTYTGRGVLLSDLLKASGIDDTGVQALRLDCFDTKGYEVSWQQLVGKNRYYFPNMDIGSQAEAVQVAPMIAIESARAPEGSSDAVSDDKLTNDDCFRLLFGVGMDEEGQNTRSMQRRWVNAIHITLAGAPPEEEGDEGAGDGRQSDAPAPDEAQAADPAAQDDNPAGGTAAAGAGNASGGGQGADAGQAVTGADGAAAADPGAAAAERRNQGAWSILQAVNRNNSDVDALDVDNPLRPYTAPVCVGLFAAGGCETFLRFRWQKRKPGACSDEEE